MKTIIGDKTGKKYVIQSISLLTELAETDNSTGFCIRCGEEAYGVEPDAHGYKCESCGLRGVYGCEQLILMGLAHSDDVAA